MQPALTFSHLFSILSRRCLSKEYYQTSFLPFWSGSHCGYDVRIVVNYASISIESLGVFGSYRGGV